MGFGVDINTFKGWLGRNVQTLKRTAVVREASNFAAFDLALGTNVPTHPDDCQQQEQQPRCEVAAGRST